MTRSRSPVKEPSHEYHHRDDSTSYSDSESSGFSSLSRSRSRSRSPVSNDDAHRRPRHSEYSPQPPLQSPPYKPKLDNPSNTIHIENVSHNATEAHLREIFGRCGRIEQVEYPRGYARITFGPSEGEEDGEVAARRAIRFMDGGQLDGNVLVVSLYHHHHHHHSHQEPRHNIKSRSPLPRCHDYNDDDGFTERGRRKREENHDHHYRHHYDRSPSPVSYNHHRHHPHRSSRSRVREPEDYYRRR